MSSGEAPLLPTHLSHLGLSEDGNLSETNKSLIHFPKLLSGFLPTFLVLLVLLLLILELIRPKYPSLLMHVARFVLSRVLLSKAAEEAEEQDAAAAPWLGCHL